MTMNNQTLADRLLKLHRHFSCGPRAQVVNLEADEYGHLVREAVKRLREIPPLSTPEPVSEEDKGEIPRHEPIRFIGGEMDGMVLRREPTPKRTFGSWEAPDQVYILATIRTYCMDHLYYYHESLHEADAIERLLLGDYDD